MTGIEKLDMVLAEMRKHHAFIEECGSNSHIGRYAQNVEIAVNEFLESKKSFYCTNANCPLNKSLMEDAK